MVNRPTDTVFSFRQLSLEQFLFYDVLHFILPTRKLIKYYCAKAVHLKTKMMLVKRSAEPYYA